MTNTDTAAAAAEIRFYTRLHAFYAAVTADDYDDDALMAACIVIDEYAAYAEDARRHEAAQDAAVAQANADCTIAYGSTTRSEGVWSSCRGLNHSDNGEIVIHDRCGAQVVRREDGRIYDIVHVGAFDARTFQCWNGRHECRPANVAAVMAERAQAEASGEIVKDCTVVVARGRKVAKGTTGQVFWIGDKGFGPSVGIRTADGATHFTPLKNCDRI